MSEGDLQITSGGDDLFSKAVDKNKALLQREEAIKKVAVPFADTLKRIALLADKAPDGRDWLQVVAEFNQRSSWEDGEIGIFIGSKDQQMGVGYFSAEGWSGERLGNMPFLVLPEDYKGQRGKYTDLEIGNSLIKLMDISREHFFDEERIRAVPNLRVQIAHLSPILSYPVRSFATHR